jgi:hypothetical protein
MLQFVYTGISYSELPWVLPRPSMSVPGFMGKGSALLIFLSSGLVTLTQLINVSK